MSQTYQVFVRSTDVGSTNPVVVAMYPETRPVDPNTHGQGLSIYVLPMEAIQQPSDATGQVPTLVDNWQSMIVPGSMAATRIAETFAVQAQIESLHHTIETMLQYGSDMSRWPLDAKQQKANADEKWKYVDAVNMRAKEHIANPPHDMASDKVWPAKPTK